MSELKLKDICDNQESVGKEIFESNECFNSGPKRFLIKMCISIAN